MFINLRSYHIIWSIHVQKTYTPIIFEEEGLDYNLQVLLSIFKIFSQNSC